MYNIRKELCPVAMYSLMLPDMKITNGIDVSKPARLRVGVSQIQIAKPRDYGVFREAFTVNHKLYTVSSSRSLEMLVGVGKDSDNEYTRTLYNYYNLPNFIRIAAIVKLEMPEEANMEIRPVTSNERVALLNVVARLKRENKLNLIPKLKTRISSFNVKQESDLAPFVIPIYPVRSSNEKTLDYRIFMIGVGWNGDSWKSNTSFEVITTRVQGSNNFVVNTNYNIDEDGLVNCKLTVENRIEATKQRQEEIYNYLMRSV